MMLDVEMLPVKVYRAADGGNLPPYGATKGCLKNILKACLVTGYTDKDGIFREPLGWEMPYESSDGFYAAFRSKDVKSRRFFSVCPKPCR